MGNCLPALERKDISGSELLSMVADGHEKAVVQLLKSGTCEEWKTRILINAAYYNRLDLVKYLLSTGTDASSVDGQALIFAASKGNYTMVKLLVSAGVNVSSQRGKALLYAVREGHLSTAKYLLAMNSYVESADDLLQISVGRHRDYGSINPHPDMYDLLVDTLRPAPMSVVASGKDQDRLVIFYL